jgi:hypothetical protein
MVTNFDNAKVILRDWGNLSTDFSQYVEEDFYLTLPPEAKGYKHEEKITFDYPISLLSGLIDKDDFDIGDICQVWFEPKGATPAQDGIIGLVSQDSVSQNKLKITLPPTLPVWCGLEFRISGKTEDYYFKTYDSENEEVEFFNEFQGTISANTPVSVRYYSVKNRKFKNEEDANFGKYSFGSKTLYPSTNMVVEWTYANVLLLQKNIRYRLNYFKGELNGS